MFNKPTLLGLGVIPFRLAWKNVIFDQPFSFLCLCHHSASVFRYRFPLSVQTRCQQLLKHPVVSVNPSCFTLSCCNRSFSFLSFKPLDRAFGNLKSSVVSLDRRLWSTLTQIFGGLCQFNFLLVLKEQNSHSENAATTHIPTNQSVTWNDPEFTGWCDVGGAIFFE